MAIYNASRDREDIIYSLSRARVKSCSTRIARIAAARHHVIFNVAEYIRFKQPTKVTLFAAASIGPGAVVEMEKIRKLKFIGGTRSANKLITPVGTLRQVRR